MSALPPESVPDPEGQDLRPDPAKIQTASELIASLREYRAWAGNPSYRQMAWRCRNRVSASAFHVILGKDTLPSARLVREFIGACGATDEYRRQFERAWRRVAIREAGRTT